MPPTTWDLEADIVVLGAGATGIPAAIRARDANASVIVVDANYDAGGHAHECREQRGPVVATAPPCGGDPDESRTERGQPRIERPPARRIRDRRRRLTGT